MATVVEDALALRVELQLPAAERFGDEALVQKVLETQQPSISGVSFREKRGEFVYQVALPIRNGARVNYVLILSKATTSFEAVIADRNLPSRWSAIIKDGAGKQVFAAVTSDGRTRARQISYDNPSIIEAIGNAGMGNDLIRVVNFVKSARIGYTKLLMAQVKRVCFVKTCICLANTIYALICACVLIKCKWPKI